MQFFLERTSPFSRTLFCLSLPPSLAVPAQSPTSGNLGEWAGFQEITRSSSKGPGNKRRKRRRCSHPRQSGCKHHAPTPDPRENTAETRTAPQAGGFDVSLRTLCLRQSSGPRDFRSNRGSAHPPAPRPQPGLPRLPASGRCQPSGPPPSNCRKVCRLFCRERLSVQLVESSPFEFL